MSTYPSGLEAVLAEHGELEDSGSTCECGFWSRDISYTQHVVDVFRRECEISSFDELDALPFGSIVRGSNGHAFEKSDEAWTFQDRAWGESGNASPDRSEDIPLPALLLFHPSWEKP